MYLKKGDPNLLDEDEGRPDDIDPALAEELEEVDDEVVGYLLELGIDPEQFLRALESDPDGLAEWIESTCDRPLVLSAKVIPFPRKATA